ncbi:MAG: hypothetical protein FXF47_01960 [Candidatus Mcinerneyibacterium aminivorans]|jgi:16S rRNA (guanine527-N7)-methyltransferase|uniref:Ribosomal RNA small subunit methyltransferase G n=1 Tax=Candidatus Mcinerneyibacterium aminivorans TaxID=2703815 RepID=A0A5D0MMP6_9BACT|nr:MAG: hypothetical protein FXF47_01960 [Candidatus Mcinerneyibacterium aminivorans]
MNNIIANYIDLLLKYKKQTNIIGTNKREEIKTIIRDSIINIPSKSYVLDFGTGAGIPGLPNKIYNPSIEISFLDKSRKKMNILTHILLTLNIKHDKILTGLASKFFQKYESSFDIVLSRGVGNAEYVLQNSLPFLKSTGTIYLWKPKNFNGVSFSKSKYNICSINVITKKDCKIVKLDIKK